MCWPAFDRSRVSQTLRLIRGATLAGAAGFGGVVVMIGWFGVRATLQQVAGGTPALPAALSVHMVQLALSALAWGALLPARVPAWHLFRARWVREAVNSIFPVASLGGAVVGTRLLTRDGISPASGAASATADITGEAIAQVFFLICGLIVAAAIPHAPLSLAALALILGPLLAMVGTLVVAQAGGLFGWIERKLARVLPARLARMVDGLQTRLRDIYRHPGRLAANVAISFCAWSLGAAEVWVLLRGLDHPAGPRVCYAIESLGLVARSVGFAVPAGLAAQETGFVLAGALFGLPRETGLAISLLKRLRELMVGVSGVLYWQWVERRLWLR